MIRALLTAGIAALFLSAPAYACVCADEPIEDRLERADAAVVGRIVGPAQGNAGAGQRLLRVEVEQRVKGGVPLDLVIRTPSGTDCDLPDRTDANVGLLLTEEPEGVLNGTLCSIVDPGPLVLAGGEPRGGALKVLIGFALLALVLAWSFRRLKRGARPDLPGAPRP